MKTPCGKYAPLFEHLRELDGEQWATSFEEVETIVGFQLPKSARRHAAWWANDQRGGHSHARAWQAAGWRTSQVNLQAQTLVFERRGGATTARRGGRRRAPPPARPKCVPASSRKATADAATGTLTLNGQTFRHAARIAPEAGPDGKPLADMPQQRYRGADSTALNPHGTGPFCRFSVAGLPAASGVYAVTLTQELVYVGIATDLERRWGPSGYGRIQPRNCFKGGQSTNCKVNHAILLAARQGLAVDLWTRLAEDPRPLERQLIAELAPPWNAQR